MEKNEKKWCPKPWSYLFQGFAIELETLFGLPRQLRQSGAPQKKKKKKNDDNK